MQETYGKHIDYEVLNSMCKSIAPAQQSWRVVIDIDQPYHVKDEAAITLLKSDEADVCYILCRLEYMAESRAKKKARVLTFEDEEPGRQPEVPPLPEGEN